MYLRPQSKTFRRKRKLEKLVELAQTGKFSAPKLAKAFKCNRKTILQVLGDNNVKLKNLGQFQKRIFCDDNFFNNLTLISSYWLGFIAADGCLSLKNRSITIGLALRDKSHLQKFKRAVHTNSNIFYAFPTNSVRISIYSGKIFDQLINFGVTPNKSLTISKVDVPQNLLSHFIKGVFDGDGSITGKRVTHLQFMIAGNKPFLKNLQENLIKNCDINEVQLYKLSGENKAFKLQYTGFQLFRIMEYLYKDSLPETRLKRKYEKYLKLKSRFLRN
ncbi:hypothetical protein COT64_00245 [Candidatus Shapirobacteria bacterium CG09_land_8_20_14_0_10_39_12]|uniref:DOD-type homing endonuclease domain-containing protein n=1 Tax=Candidatus Shapirobacteria bacterium CG09_land_8_20_14_0_10_39_12 TaxID=1974885 RepID=A0A2H0WSI5_9BACT|nr:MAG: hypothetical protein COT64_00245 [Candidatus Shapirobacteria bacterium CG09_land_8_20_14_0_10_39_12]